MYKILNYNKDSNKKINYKLYRLLLIMLYASCLFILICMCFNYKIGIILLILWIISFIILNLIIYFILKKYFNCSVYILNENNHEFYKMGIFPNAIRFTPNDEQFLTDNYFGNYIYSSIGKALKLGITKQLSYSVNEYAKDNVNFKTSKTNQLLNLNTLIKLNNQEYVLKQLDNNKFKGIVFKITKIYSYDFNENDNYYIICDVIENNKKIEHKMVKLAINKLFEENDLIKNYIINNCEVNNEEVIK